MSSVTKFSLIMIVTVGLLITAVVIATSIENSKSTTRSEEEEIRESLSISNIRDNRSAYLDGQIPKYEKLEITFQVQNSVARNFQFPYDPNPPNGVDLSYPAYQGITVDALLTPDNWQTVYKQPAFHYQYFDEDVIDDGRGQIREWYLPTADFAWKARFSPNQVGTWQFKLVALDASGFGESQTHSFEVVDSENHGFIKVSQNDGRYFEFDDGQLFFPLGVQGKGYLEDPIAKNDPLFQTYEENGINFKRIWISEMYGSAWLEWLGGRNIYNAYLPRSGIVPFYDSIRDRFSLTQRLDYEKEGDTGWFDACRFQFWNNPEAIKSETDYLLRIKYWGEGIAGPRIESFANYGLVGKIGGEWEVDCYEPGTSNVVTDFGRNTADWDYIEGTWHSGSNNFLPKIYLGLENVTEGHVNIDSISLREVLGNGQFGPEIIAAPSMEYELYYPEQEAYALDKIIELAEQNDLYLKLVVHEKNDDIFMKLKDDGAYVYRDQDGNLEPDNHDGFYGVGRQINKTRWLQRAWWRYLQARWGYSTAIHSWELNNEGNPGNPNHYALADEFGKFLHCQVFGAPVSSGDGERCNYDHPNDHLVTTSFWHSFPSALFWANPDYPNVDYADLHAYVSTGFLPVNPEYQFDAALFHLNYSRAVRNNLNRISEENGVPTKPIIRGETGIDFLDEQRENPDLAQDLNGVWLHNLIWSSLDPGAMTELYWWPFNIAGQPGPDGSSGLYEVFGYFREFVEDIPFANGHYLDAEVALIDDDLRVTGQKDVVNGQAHLWVQNKNHSWRNVVDGAEGISGLSGTVTLDGFRPNQSFAIEWYEFTTHGLPTIRHSSVASSQSGEIVLSLPTNPSITDVGIKINE